MSKQVVTTVIFITLLSGCNQAPEQHATELGADIEAINRLNDEYVDAPDVLVDLRADLTIAKPVQRHVAQFDTEILGGVDGSGQKRR